MKNMRLAHYLLMSEAPFDASLLRSMQLIYTEDLAFCPTAQTDCRKKVWFNTRWARDFDPHSIMFVLAHEARHKLYSHHEPRRPDMDPELFNAAADFVINGTLFMDGFKCPAFKPASVEQFLSGKAPPNAVLHDKDINPHWGVVTTYHHLLNRAKKRGKNQSDSGSARPGNFDGPPVPGSAITPDEQSEITTEVAVAAAMARSAGRSPASLERLIGETLSPKVDWREELYRLVTQAMASGVWAEGWSYRRPHRRSGEIILPIVEKPPTGPIIVTVDTSGSIADRVLDVFAAELRAIHEDTNPVVLHVLYADADVRRVDSFAPGEVVDLRPLGGGGTDFRPALRWPSEEPMCFIYLTDGHGAYPSEPPGFPVIWAMTTDRTPPFGHVVRLDVER